MSERAPEGPKPGPGLHKVETQEDTIARFEAELAAPASPLAVEPSFKVVDKRNAASQAWSHEKSEAAQAELDKALAAVEATPVEDATEVVTETKTVAEPAVEAAAIADSSVLPEAEAPASPEAVGVAEAAPERGGKTHHDYHAQRPAEGSVYRTSKNFQRAPGGSEPAGIAKNGREAYDKQIGANDPNSADRHYDEINGLNEAQPATPERPSYETMDTDQLVFAYAKAEMIGDKHVTDDIRNVYTTAIEEAYTKPGSAISYEEYEDALARFDRLADAAVEYEKAKNPEHSALVDAAVERANKEPSVGDKLKKWWGKHGESITKPFRPSYWAERWENAVKPALQKGYDKVLNVGVKPEDDPEEVERKRKRNRVFFIAGGAALAVGALATSYGIGFAVGSGSGHHAAEALGGGGGGRGHVGTGVGESLASQHQTAVEPLTPLPGSGGETTVTDAAAAAAAEEAAKAAQHAAETIPAAFNISPGEGGLQLFSDLSIDPSKWAANAHDFVTKFPQDFYNMQGGGVGLAHPGMLSPEARNAIEALR